MFAASLTQMHCQNSPMYDCTGPGGVCSGACPTCAELFHPDTGQMQLIDVGMTSMVISESRHLATVAGHVGRDADAATLRSHADALAASLTAYNWDNSSGMFTNRRPSGGTFYRRFSPTSFYALMAKAATDEQAAAMTQQWLLNPEHFAITVKGDHAGNSDANWWD